MSSNGSSNGSSWAIFWNNFWFTIKQKIANNQSLSKPLYSNYKVAYPQTLVNLIWFLHHSWYFNYIYNYYIAYMIMQSSYEYFYKLIDKGFIEIWGVRGLSSTCYELSLISQRESLGYIYHLNCFLIINFIIIISIILIF